MIQGPYEAKKGSPHNYARKSHMLDETQAVHAIKQLPDRDNLFDCHSGIPQDPAGVGKHVTPVWRGDETRRDTTSAQPGLSLMSVNAGHGIPRQ